MGLRSAFVDALPVVSVRAVLPVLAYAVAA